MVDSQSPDIVLVVDDSPDTLKMLTDALEDAGMRVLVARDGWQALSMIEKVAPDVILLDAVMPGMDGFETCRRLKSNDAVTHVPVIFMTGLTETEDVIHGLEAGGVDYVTKPIVPDELLARIRVHLGNARAAHGARTALDTLGRFLLAANRAGEILWATPQASKLLARAFGGFEAGEFTLPRDVQDWLRRADFGQGPEAVTLAPAAKLSLAVVAQVAPNEILLRLVNAEAVDEQSLLRSKLTLTHREAEVLLWIARGKSNRDIADILTLSPRTVNKHLEQIYAKLGVENRTSAAALAMRTLAGR
ncbi:MAG: DNA-binding response regulator [Proteobacteria bacterium]|nr:MAG: DNA-binding response regulator [Pseudomonadota bacterium]